LLVCEYSVWRGVGSLGRGGGGGGAAVELRCAGQICFA